jgi:hypothetical protein
MSARLKTGERYLIVWAVRDRTVRVASLKESDENDCEAEPTGRCDFLPLQPPVERLSSMCVQGLAVRPGPGYSPAGGATTSSLRPASSNARRTRPEALASSMKAVA